MHFKDLKSKAGIKELNEWLQSRSYIDGFLPTKADTETFSQLGVVTSDEFAHVLRWFNHIKSFTDAERKHWSDAKASTSAPQKSADVKPKGGGGDDDDFDLFGEDDEDDEEKERVKQERLKAYEDKKSKKPGPIAKSSIVLDVKPWDDQTDLKEIERKVREIACDGLIWAQQAKIIPVAYGISKLQIGCVVEDDKVSVDFLEESITALEDLVQSVDIAAFNKI